MICTDAYLCLWLAALMLFLPLDWVLSALTAALVHEFCHIAVLLVLGGKIKLLRISVSGCVLDGESPGDFVSFCSIMAGPIGSMALLMLTESLPKIAVCGLFHGLYNLLPVYPLDGGRMLGILLNRYMPKKGDTVLTVIGWIVCSVLLLFSLRWAESTGYFPFFVTLIWILRFLPRKIPCKPPQIKVQ